jgi:WD40 repeat protein/serine/threonine protein kinase
LPAHDRDRPDATRVGTPPPSVPGRWAVGTVLHDVHELRLIERVDEEPTLALHGGMGEVYKVWHRGWNLDLALKRPRAAYFTTAGTSVEEAVRRFEREVEAWVSLGMHPNICACFYLRRAEGIPCVFAEWVQGATLQQWVDDRRLYEGDDPGAAVERILLLAVQLARALAYAHTKEIVHRDVKPGNCLLDEQGLSLKLADFGLAGARAPAEQAGLLPPPGGLHASHGGMTPAYCSPEQAAGGSVGPASDCYSFAVSILELFAGAPPAFGRVAPDLLERLTSEGPPHPHLPRMPEPLAMLLGDCLTTESGQRPPLEEVASKLERIYQEQIGAPYPVEPPVEAELLADSLNNQALVMLELNQQERAQRLLSAALDIDWNHLLARYNSDLLLWLRGEVDDKSLVAGLTKHFAAHGHPWQASRLLALVHLERGDVEAALELLHAATAEAGEQPELAAALALASSEHVKACRTLATLKGHAGEVNAVAISADGRHAISGGDDHTVRVWELPSGRCLDVLEGHTSPVLSVSISADGRHAISGGDDHTLRLWELDVDDSRGSASGRCLRVLEGHTRPVRSVAISGDGRRAISGSDDHTVRLWELPSGRCKVFERHTAPVLSVAISGDGRRAISGSDDHTVRLWELPSGRSRHLHGPDDRRPLRQGRRGRSERNPINRANAVTLSVDGRVAVTGSDDGSLCIWKLGQPAYPIYAEATVEWPRVTDLFADSAATRSFAASTPNATKRRIPLTSLSLSADGHLALSAGGNVRLWEITSRRCRRVLDTYSIGRGGALRRTHRRNPVCLSADGRYALVPGDEGEMHLWKLPGKSLGRSLFQVARPTTYPELVETDRLVRELLERAEQAMDEGRLDAALTLVRRARSQPGHSQTPRALQLWLTLGRCCQHTRLVATRPAGTTRTSLSRPAGLSVSDHPRAVFAGGRGTILGLPRFVSGADLVYWDLANGERLTERGWSATDGGRRGVAESGHKVASVCGHWPYALSGGTDGTVRLTDVAHDTSLCVLTGHSGSVDAVCLDQHPRHPPDSRSDRDSSGVSRREPRFALSGSADETLRLWELDVDVSRRSASGRCLRVLEGHTGPVLSVAMTPDCRYALSGSADCTLRLWNLVSGRCLRPLEGHQGDVSSVCLSADQRHALSGSYDGTLRFWELTSGECLHTLVQRPRVWSVSLAADGQYAFSGSDDGTLRLWNVANEKCIKTIPVSRDPWHVWLSPDGSQAIALSADISGGQLAQWELDWDLQSHEPADWDDAARPHLESFLSLHTPFASELPRWQRPLLRRASGRLTRAGKPSWSARDFEDLIRELQNAGYGWLRTQGVSAELERMARDWNGPPPLFT